MQIFVRGNEIKSINVDPTQSVSEFKATVAKTFDLRDVTQMNLYLNGAPLQQLSDVLTQQTIDLDIGLIGGKVHGSLARAGKVKGQTPKVDKSEEGKKKAKTGRAKRRLQYNRRFVNVVVGPGGRRKGPNANAGGQASQT